VSSTFKLLIVLGGEIALWPATVDHHELLWRVALVCWLGYLAYTLYHLPADLLRLFGGQ
jgi:hypothetical protein